ncbi:TonB-dependent receptor [Sphingomonas yunnanensis]|uniref:TonB-dependent receptor n=1 Tax=Sphingomonas yunnanensis TaxID=310400 RepID=UPI001CA67F0D|nr:TonB-dependent receptor [Sphingomonas yunnanensis]MBY9063419.1 TonB-dependent receptor [Sphingomonas yunnanensis]
MAREPSYPRLAEAIRHLLAHRRSAVFLCTLALPRVSVSYAPIEAATVYASYAQGVRTGDAVPVFGQEVTTSSGNTAATSYFSHPVAPPRTAGVRVSVGI